MRYHVTAVCQATLTEYWLVDIPDDTSDEYIEDEIRDAMSAGNAEFISEESDNEEDREITSIEEAE
jgi:hypothetical protein